MYRGRIAGDETLVAKCTGGELLGTKRWWRNVPGVNCWGRNIGGEMYRCQNAIGAK